MGLRALDVLTSRSGVKFLRLNFSMPSSILNLRRAFNPAIELLGQSIVTRLSAYLFKLSELLDVACFVQILLGHNLLTLNANNIAPNFF